MFETTIRNGVVRVWDVYRQQWVTAPAWELRRCDRILSTLTQRERDAIEAAAATHPRDVT